MGQPWEWGWGTWALLGIVLAASLWWDKRRKQGGSSGPVLFVPVAGTPVKRGPGLLAKALFVIVLFFGLLLLADKF